ncbi:hypothetical protein [Ralstonia pickettii]|uniref:hypothetical protein n=1 Tax=Ralstonia pickettii TaxID=329 RepID=UPI0011AF9D72|nr:hypothetical protein [Ralstonia pickettii]
MRDLSGVSQVDGGVPDRFSIVADTSWGSDAWSVTLEELIERAMKERGVSRLRLVVSLHGMDEVLDGYPFFVVDALIASRFLKPHLVVDAGQPRPIITTCKTAFCG